MVNILVRFQFQYHFINIKCLSKYIMDDDDDDDSNHHERIPNHCNAHIPGRCQDPAQVLILWWPLDKFHAACFHKKIYHSEAGSNPVTLLLAVQDHLIWDKLSNSCNVFSPQVLTKVQRLKGNGIAHTGWRVIHLCSCSVVLLCCCSVVQMCCWGQWRENNAL